VLSALPEGPSSFAEVSFRFSHGRFRSSRGTFALSRHRFRLSRRPFHSRHLTTEHAPARIVEDNAMERSIYNVHCPTHFKDSNEPHRFLQGPSRFSSAL